MGDEIKYFSVVKESSSAKFISTCFHFFFSEIQFPKKTATVKKATQKLVKLFYYELFLRRFIFMI